MAIGTVADVTTTPTSAPAPLDSTQTPSTASAPRQADVRAVSDPDHTPAVAANQPAGDRHGHRTMEAGHPDSVTGFGRWLNATGGLAASTVSTYTAHARDYRRWWSTQHGDVAPACATPTDVEAYLAHLAGRGLSAATRRTALHALRSYYRWLLSATPASPESPTGTPTPTVSASGRPLVSTAAVNPAAQVRRPRVRQARTQIYTEAEADMILDAAHAWHPRTGASSTASPSATPPAPAPSAPPGLVEPPELRAALDHAVLATLRWTGIRASELCNLVLGDLPVAEDGQLGELHVHGKGSKHRQVPVPAPLAAILADYLDQTRPGLQVACPIVGRLFLNPAGATGVLTTRALLDMCRRHGAGTGLRGPHHPLRWRHTYATHTLARGTDLHTVARLLGHARVTTTERYLHLDTAALTSAIERAYPTPPDQSTGHRC